MTPTPPPSPSLLTRLLHHMLNPTLPVLGHPLVGAVAIPTAAVFAIHALVGAPSVLLLKSERFYDLTGALGFLTVSGLSLYLPALRARVTAKVGGAVPPAWPSPLDALTGSAGGGAGDTAVSLGWRQVVITACVMIWATRCKTTATSLRLTTKNDEEIDVD